MHEPAAYPPVLEATMRLDNPYFGKLPYAQATIGSLTKEPAPIYDGTAKWTAVHTMGGEIVAAILNGANVRMELNALAEKMQVVLDQK
jgi:hypothetical protein